MYEENKFKINWIDIIIKIVLIIAFILFLIWLFPKQDLSVFSDSIYSDNINKMKDAAKSYYTRDRLPENVGESTSMSLRQMLDNKMLIRFTDKDKNYCDESTSKVEVTKISENEYVLRVQLNCGDQEDYILETIGCNDVCPDGKCDVAVEPTTPEVPTTPNVQPTTPDISYFESVTYYQFRKAFYTDSVNYTCPDGYTLNESNRTCTKGSTGATIDATPVYFDDQVITTDAKINYTGEYTQYIDPITTTVDSGYTCPEGYTLNGAYCIKYTNAVEVPGNVSYVCPDGYTLNGNKCTYAYNASYQSGEYNYTCPNGGTVNGTKCILTIPANRTTKETCPNGYTPNGANCVYVYNASYQSGEYNYTCPNGGQLNGTKCVISTNATKSYKEVCPSGYTANGSSCYKVYNPTKVNETTCKSGYTKSGSTCVKYTTYDAKKTISSYTCPNGGTLSGTKCIKNSETNPSYKKTYGAWKASGGIQYKTSATAAYVRDTEKLEYIDSISGRTCGSPCGNKGIWYMYQKYTRTVTNTPYCTSGKLNSSKTKCIITGTSYDATPKYKYTCNSSSDTLDGSKCKKISDKYNLGYNYTCPNGGTYNNSTGKCTITTNKVKQEYTTCPNGYNKSGNKCIKEYSATRSQGNGSYYCPNGGNLNGTKCTLTANKITEEEITCPSGYNKYGTQCVKEYNSTVVQGNGSYYCPNGGTLSGTKCTLTIDASIVNGSSTYTCPTGYVLDGTKCKMEINATKKTETVYSCPTGYTQSGEGAATKCSKVVAGDITYYCEDAGATLNGTKCTKKVPGGISHYTCPSDEYTLNGTTCVKRSVITIDATENKSQSVSYKYTWSTSSTLDGWEFTGKTKTEQYKAGQK